MVETGAEEDGGGDDDDDDVGEETGELVCDLWAEFRRGGLLTRSSWGCSKQVVPSPFTAADSLAFPACAATAALRLDSAVVAFHGASSCMLLLLLSR